jgi:DNA topoisomerase-1
MSKNLLIVESPAKAKTIGKILGKDFEVKSSVGHIRDLPERNLGVDIENGFAPKYVISPGKTKVVEELRKAAKACEAIYLAPDPDREGEAIAWHLQAVLATAAKGKPFYRVQYNEITPRAVREAIAHPGEINQPRVDAQQARRILDRIVGYMVSPLLWRRVRRGLSAGRVQSVALRLVCERERLIQAFKPEAYWIMGAVVRKQVAPVDPFTVKLARLDGQKADVRSEEQARALLADLEGRALRVGDIRTRQVTRRPLPPFITSTLQQAASSVCGFSPNRTMSLAQKLYEGVDLGAGGPSGLITYMRTDSVNVSQDALAEVRTFIVNTYGEAFRPEAPNVYRSRASAQEAHEAVRPTDVSRTPESLRNVLEPPALRLYDLIWRRFVASQMSAARIEQRTAVIVSAPPPAQQHAYEFTATASDVAFAGFLKVMELDIRKSREAEGEESGEADEVERLPALAVGESISLVEWLSDRKETKPPARFTEAALVKALEANGVGRPSTYASIIETLVSRDYVTREKRTLAPTTIGFQVCDLLVAKLNDLFDVGFTAAMEESLDKVEEGAVDWTVMMGEFYARFTTWMANAKEPPADLGRVKGALALVERVQTWAPAVKRGKRTYSDEKFVASVREQMETGEKPISDRQLEALARMALRYRGQLPDMTEALGQIGFAAMVATDDAAPPHALTLRRFELLRAVELGEEQRRFIDSLNQQADSGRRLTENQMRALDRIVMRNAAHIPNFEQVSGELGLGAQDAASEADHESEGVLAVFAHVTTWRAATARGKRTFDDKVFFDSLSGQFAQRKWLSPRQRAALKKMLFRYKEQIPDFEATIERLGLRKAKGEAEAEKAEGQAEKAEG